MSGRKRTSLRDESHEHVDPIHGAPPAVGGSAFTIDDAPAASMRGATPAPLHDAPMHGTPQAPLRDGQPLGYAPIHGAVSAPARPAPALADVSAPCHARRRGKLVRGQLVIEDGAFICQLPDDD